jgi:hypothetical protein
MRFEVFLVVKMVLWAVMPCGHMFQRNILFPSSELELEKHWYLPTGPCGVTAQKTGIDMPLFILYLAVPIALSKCSE